MEKVRWNHVGVGFVASPDRLQSAQVFVFVDGAVCFPRRPRLSLLSSMVLRQVPAFPVYKSHAIAVIKFGCPYREEE